MGDDRLYGSTGSDKLSGGAGRDVLYGGSGYNILSGGDGTDYLAGGIHAEKLFGAGNDKLSGSRGGDTVAGSLGNDVLSGGSGRDVFFFDAKLNSLKNTDRVLDFRVNYDKIKIDDAIFKAAGPHGALSDGAFSLGSTAQDTQDRIIYNAGNGALYYDPDGSGAAAQVRFAVVKPGLTARARRFLCCLTASRWDELRLQR